MEKPGTPVIGSIALAILAAVVLVVIARIVQSDVAFCREVFRGLVEGKPSVQRRIDWEHLSALNVNVGATYTRLPNDQERADYRRTFIEHFSKGFRQVGGTTAGFRHWRVLARKDQKVVVAADYEAKQKTLLMSVPASGTRKLETIQWQ